MKVKLIKPFLNRSVGTVVTMHPYNARRYAQMGYCEALTDKEQEYLDIPIPGRRRIVETQVKSRTTENEVLDMVMVPKRTRKPRRTRETVTV